MVFDTDCLIDGYESHQAERATRRFLKAISSTSAFVSPRSAYIETIPPECTKQEISLAVMPYDQDVLISCSGGCHGNMLKQHGIKFLLRGSESAGLTRSSFLNNGILRLDRCRAGWPLSDSTFLQHNLFCLAIKGNCRNPIQFSSSYFLF